MHAHYLFVNQSHERHVVKALVECLPKTEFVPSLYLVEETVDSGDGLAFVVTSKDYNLFWETNFESEEEAYDFSRLATSVHVITHEEVSLVFIQNHFLLFVFIFVGHFFKHMKKFRKLAVQVSKDSNWSFKCN